MTPERLREIERLFHEARERPPAERDAWLARACANDPALQREVESLLAQPAAAMIDTSVGALLNNLFRLPASEARDVDTMRDQAPLDDARFAPGHIFATRFRIVSLLGRGGMGEVYRAEDLKLGRAVALKLLTVGSRDPDRLKRFISEVRLARDISHPNVCRVYDIGHADGWDYLSMEYVDGETLASLLHRIGRLPDEKALDVARQLCAGLIAAHDRGVLHRDLTPSNVMLDGNGRARIMDFGLAVDVRDARKPERAGTPAYMAPEQIAGERVTEQTDIYAFGLLLFELFTGRMIFPVSRFEERRHAKDAAAIARAAPGGISKPIHAMICRCLEVDPAKRPKSISAIAATLPGGDPLTAALAEGRIPSPEMVAAVRETGALTPVVAWLLLASVLGGALGVASQVEKITELRPSSAPRPPEVLVDRARMILASIGLDEIPRDSAFWFKSASLNSLGAASRSESGLPGEDVSQRFPFWFVYRQSAEYLIPQNPFHVVTETDPPTDVAGMSSVILDSQGRLVQFTLTASEVIRPSVSAPNPGWPALFTAAGLDASQLVRTESSAIPPVPHDNRYAWEGGRTASGHSLRITAAALAGRPVYFDVATAGAISSERRNWFLPSRRPWAELLLAGVVVGAVAGAIVLARRNLRLGQGDPQGAKALCAVVLCGTSMWTLIAAHHVPVISEEWRLFEFAAVSSVGWAGFSWLMYMGLEPYVRRWWPTTLIGWTRLVSGRARDAIVGREVLAGLLAGVVVDALLILRFELARRGGLNLAPYNTAVDPGFNPLLESLRSGRHFAGVLTFLTLDALQFALGGLFLLVVIRMIVRRSWLAILVWTLLASALNLLEGSALGLTFLYAAATAAIATLVLLRRGLLALAVMLFCSRLLARVPLTLDLDAWYLGISVVTLCLIGALATCGFVLALARGPSVEGTARGVARPGRL